MDNKKKKYNILSLIGGILIILINVALLVVDDKGPSYLGFAAGIAFTVAAIINLKKESKVGQNQ